MKDNSISPNKNHYAELQISVYSCT